MTPASRAHQFFSADPHLERTATAAVSKWLAANGWSVVTSELGYVPKQFPQLTDTQRQEAGEFLQSIEDHDDVHRIWAALK